MQELIREIIKNTWGYASGLCVFLVDNSTTLGALLLVALQVVYQLYRIKKVRMECGETKDHKPK